MQQASPRVLDRKQAVPKIIGDPSDFLIISGLAGTGKDVGHLSQESGIQFLMTGAMGAACMTGFGLALAQPDRQVLVVTGDAELLMGVGALATIGAEQPSNLAIVCVDNGHNGETGYQPSHTNKGVDLEMIARGAGIQITRTVSTEDQLIDAARAIRQGNGPVFIWARVTTDPPPVYKRNLDAVECKLLFRRRLLGQQ